MEPLSIAVQWVVFSELSTDAMVATGITDEPSTARWMVETILADTSHAGWGEVRRAPRHPGPVLRLRLDRVALDSAAVRLRG